MKIIKIINNKVVDINCNESQIGTDNIICYEGDINVGDYDTRININVYKNIKKQIIDEAFNLIMSSGYNTGLGYYLSAEKSDRDAFSQDAILHERAISTNLISDTDNVSFLDLNGIPRTLIVSEYRNLLKSYGLWCRNQILNYNGKLFMLDIASTIDEINNI